MRLHLLALFSVLLSSPFATTAQAVRKDVNFQIACPPTVDLTYSAVGELNFGSPGDPKYAVEGWKPHFTPVAVRLLDAQVNPGAGKDGEIVGHMADNATTVQAGQPLIYTFWAEGAKAPDFAAHILCGYEGGFAMQQALPPTTRSCALRTKWRKAASSETTTREFLVSANFSCR